MVNSMRLIDADKMIKRLQEWNTSDVYDKAFFNFAMNRIIEQPTVEAREVVHGYVKTVVGKMGVMHQECSVCGNALDWKEYPNYCDECGAKLDMRTSAK